MLCGNLGNHHHVAPIIQIRKDAPRAVNLAVSGGRTIPSTVFHFAQPKVSETFDDAPMNHLMTNKSFSVLLSKAMDRGSHHHIPFLHFFFYVPV